ncbi:MAG: hypothetical protein JSU05_06060 [Bacteroidetes bacterium]|nr:hypothetical protein [Bacteroidota bacterium]
MKTSLNFLFGMALISLCFLSGKCRKDSENCHYKIGIHNNSSVSIFIKWQLNYPDTSILDPSPLLQGAYYEVTPGRNDFSISSNDCFEDIYRFRSVSDTIMFFVFQSDTLRANTWDNIKMNYKILKRYDLSLFDLRNSGFTITYQ